MRKFFSKHRTKGFTLIELMVSITILTLLSIFGGRIYLNYTDATRDLKAANLVYEEARFLMEKIVREVRQNGLDYEQYFNQNINVIMNPGDSYTDNYCSYSSFFYDDEGESRGVRNSVLEDDIINIYSLEPDAVRPIENELYLINLSGNERTVLTRVEKVVDGETIGKVAMLKMIGKDFGDDHINGRDSYNGSHDPNCEPDDREGDGLIDTWHCDAGYPCDTELDTISTSNPACEGHTHYIINDPRDPDHSFVDISPNALNIINLQFIVAPKDDPWKAYNMNEVQIQPHVTIQMTAKANPKLVGATTEELIPSITLTSTVTTRNYNEINSDCR